MKKQHRFLTLQIAGFLFLAVIGAVCLFFGRGIPLSEQLPLYEALRTTSAIVFGIMGAWIAILYPGSLAKLFGNKESSEVDGTHEKVYRLIPTMVVSTIILACVLLVAFAAPAMKQIPWLVNHRHWLRSISYALLGILTVLQFWSLIMTLVPSDTLKREIEQYRSKQKQMDNIRQHTQQVERPEVRKGE